MDGIKQIRYNKMRCTKCGELTSADLVGFNFSKIFATMLEQQSDENWKPLVRLDLKFYYTLRDICQELHFQLNRNGTSELTLTVGKAIKQLEFLMKPATFSDIKNSHRETLLYNKIYEAIPSSHGTPDEKMADIETLIRNLSSFKTEDIIVSVPISFIFDKDDINNEMPIGIRYNVNGKQFEERRVCPHCGEQFDGFSGYHREFIIGLAGLARVGKTAYIASLVHQLKKYSDDNFISISINDDNKDSFYRFNEDIVSVYEKGKIINKTEVENVEEIPLVYVTVKINGKDFNFVFVDMPGEIFNNDNDEGADFVSEKRQILKSADAIWCCIEPSMINNKYHNIEMNVVKRDGNDQLANLVTTLNNLYTKKIPACIIVTQCDLLQEDYPMLFNPTINIFEEYLMEDNTLNVTKMNDYVRKTRAFVKKMVSFEATIEDVFEGFSMFGIASYGFDVRSNVLGDKVIKPSMVELPFLWTLANLGCIEVTKTNISRNIFGKEKETLSKVTNKKELYVQGGK